MIKQVLYLLLLFNYTEPENKLLPCLQDGSDSRPELSITPPIEETLRNITINMEKNCLLKNLENPSLSVFKKLLLIENYFGRQDDISSTTNNIFGGGLLKDSDFFNLL